VIADFLVMTVTAADCCRLLGLRVVNVYDVDNKTYLIKLAKLVSLVFCLKKVLLKADYVIVLVIVADGDCDDDDDDDDDDE